MTSLKRQQGIVIILALFMVALIATLAYIMIARLERDTYRTRLITRNAQAENYANGSLIWAMDQLRIDWIKQKAKHLVDLNPIISPVNEINGFRIQSRIYDVQSKFNLNNLANNLEAQEDFKHLLHLVAQSLGNERVQEIVNAVVDWISPNQDNNEFGRYYLKLSEPYRAAHRLFVSVSELNLVKGITPKIYTALKPYIIALPTSTPINVQTASLPVLATLNKTMNLETAKAIERERNKNPLTAKEDFLNLEVIKNHKVAPEKIDVKSNYFLVETNIDTEKQHMVLHTLMERNSQDSNVSVRIVWQSKYDE